MKDPDYSNKKKHAAALGWLTKRMAAHDTPPPTRAEVQEKMNSLRVNFVNNKKASKGTSSVS